MINDLLKRRLTRINADIKLNINLLLCAALWCILLLYSCEVRPLFYEEQKNASFRIVPDWGTLAAGEEKPQYIKAMFFPTDGRPALERFIDADGGEVNVPQGEYKIIVYNWRTNAEVQSVQFRGDTYDTFEAYVAPRSAALNNRVDGTAAVIPAPDTQLYAWSTGASTVIISGTSPTVRTRGVQSDALTSPMHSVVRTYRVMVNVQNAQYLSGATATATYAYTSVLLSNGTLGGDHCGVETFIEKGEEANGVTPYYCLVAAFGLVDEGGKFLNLELTKTDGTKVEQQIDISDHVANVDLGLADKNTPQEVTPPEDPIVVTPPEEGTGGDGGGFAPPLLDDWEEVDKEIIM